MIHHKFGALRGDVWTHRDSLIKIGHSGLIEKSARHGAMRGDILTLRLKSDGRDEGRNVGPRRGIMGHVTRAIVAVDNMHL